MVGCRREAVKVEELKKKNREKTGIPGQVGVKEREDGELEEEWGY